MNKQEAISTTNMQAAAIQPNEAHSVQRSSRDKKSMIPDEILKFVNFIPLEEVIQSCTPNDIGFGELFADTFSRILRYVDDTKTWRYFDGTRWVEDASKTVAHQCAKVLVEYLKKSSHDGIDEFVNELSKRPKRKSVKARSETAAHKQSYPK